jgi:hypothetical protein
MIVIRRTPFVSNKKKTKETLGRCGDLSPEMSRDRENKENQAD